MFLARICRHVTLLNRFQKLATRCSTANIAKNRSQRAVTLEWFFAQHRIIASWRCKLTSVTPPLLNSKKEKIHSPPLQREWADFHEESLVRPIESVKQSASRTTKESLWPIAVKFRPICRGIVCLYLTCKHAAKNLAAECGIIRWRSARRPMRQPTGLGSGSTPRGAGRGKYTRIKLTTLPGTLIDLSWFRLSCQNSRCFVADRKWQNPHWEQNHVPVSGTEPKTRRPNPPLPSTHCVLFFPASSPSPQGSPKCWRQLSLTLSWSAAQFSNVVRAWSIWWFAPTSVSNNHQLFRYIHQAFRHFAQLILYVSFPRVALAIVP